MTSFVIWTATQEFTVATPALYSVCCSVLGSMVWDAGDISRSFSRATKCYSRCAGGINKWILCISHTWEHSLASGWDASADCEAWSVFFSVPSRAFWQSSNWVPDYLYRIHSDGRRWGNSISTMWAACRHFCSRTLWACPWQIAIAHGATPEWGSGSLPCDCEKTIAANVKSFHP